MSRLRIVFFGTAELACPSLSALAEDPRFEVVAVVTQPDRPKGRNLKLQPSPVKVEAVRRALPVLQPEKARRPEFVQALGTLQPDIVVVAAYGQILPSTILDLPRFGCVNVHTSLLPKYRGAAPIQWAILNDEKETGVTIMKMDEGLDTGDILTQESTPIHDSDNAQTLHDRLAEIGAALWRKTLPAFVAGQITPRKQPAETATYAAKINKEDGKLDWQLPARVLWNKVRAYTPWPGAFTSIVRPGGAALLKIWEAEIVVAQTPDPGVVLSADKQGVVVSCGTQALRVLKLQREGGRAMPVADFLAGHPLAAGTRLGA